MTRFGPQDARRFYDRFAEHQDSQSWYEDAAFERLIAWGAFDAARHVVEIGPGTGRFAARLFMDILPEDARYTAVEVSPRMAALTRERLARWSGRVRVDVDIEGRVRLPVGDGTADRVVATYVLDLLDRDDQARFFREAARVLRPGGLLCIANLARGHGVLSRAVSGLWSAIYRIDPRLVGGCRPIEAVAMLGSAFTVEHHNVVRAWGLSSEVLVARRAGA